MSSVTIDESTSGVYLLNEFPLHPIRTKNANCTASDVPHCRGQPCLEKPTQQNTEEVMKLYKAVNTGVTATPALSYRGSTQSKTVRVVILKIGRRRLRKVVEEPIIDVAESGKWGILALAREDAQAESLTDSKSHIYRTVRNSCCPPDLTTVNDLYKPYIRERAGLNMTKLVATQDPIGYSTQKVSCLRDEIPQESMMMSRFQVLHNGVKLLHSMRSVAGGNTLHDQLRLTESDIEEVYVSNKRLKLMSLEKTGSYEKIEELKTYREALSDPIHGREW